MNKKYMAIFCGVIMLAGCSSRNTEINVPDKVLINDLETGAAVNANIIENLPKEQQDAELNKALAQLRTLRKAAEGQTKDGQFITIVPNGADLPNQSKNKPEFNESHESVGQLITLTTDYVQNILKIPERSYGYDISLNMDTRIDAIYDDEDKGVAAGYTNENILVYEYETEVDDSYSFLFVVRDSKDSPWKIIHHGNSYKEE